MIQIIYSLFILLTSPIVGLIFLFSRKGRIKIYQRYGFWGSLDKTATWVWFHAASLGELGAIEQIVREVRNNDNKVKVLLTVTSPSALEKVNSSFDAVKLLPFDSEMFYWLAVGKTKIKCAIFTETEIWPGLLCYLHNRNISTRWINARMMASSYNKYLLFSWFFKPLFLKIDSIAAQTVTDTQRFRKCGAVSVVTLGNTKYEALSASSNNSDLLLTLKQIQSQIIAVTNIRPGEEKIIFPSLQKYKDNFLIFIMPRHRETYTYFEQKLKTWNLEFSYIKDLPKQSGIIFVDKFGILEDIVSVSAGVIAAGSFLPQYKGHNPLVAAYHSIPMCTGPFNESSQPVLEELKEKDAVFVANSAQAITEYLYLVLNKSQSVIAQGERANEYLSEHLGATTRVVNWLIQNTNTENPISRKKNGFLALGFLWMSSRLFALITYIRNQMFNFSILKSYKSSRYVISVGNLSVGGTGKTPLVIKLLLDLTKKGYRCSVVSRGYGGKEQGPFVISSQNIRDIDAQSVGDEPLEIFHATGCPVVIAKNRKLGVQLVEQQNLSDIILIDDGFQHRWIHRDFNIICVDVSNKESVSLFLSGNLLPLGVLREDIDIALPRIDRIVFSSRQSGKIHPEVQVWIESIKVRLPKIESHISYYSAPKLRSFDGQILSDNNYHLGHRKNSAFVFCGIGNPEGFIQTIKNLELQIEEPVFIVEDHHFFTPTEQSLILDKVNQGKLVITTRKDFLRLPVDLQQKIFWVDVQLIIEPDLTFVLPLEEQLANVS